jgi:hypothetical protein
MMDKEVIALLPPDDRTDGRWVSEALVRFADGRMAIEGLCEETARTEAPAARFRRSHPIIDPLTREVIGYEMEQVLLRAGT